MILAFLQPRMDLKGNVALIRPAAEKMHHIILELFSHTVDFIRPAILPAHMENCVEVRLGLAECHGIKKQRPQYPV